ncbi:hypothetical protein [Campylobacter sp. 19-13652]|uniref:hypothetical protein n=1 Tax=Campylobacter sp. 19-13652 TaxID=2840180 RepID=UPI001C864F2B|nr:hypothetical protein [Campylobacter sp. 19-13652]
MAKFDDIDCVYKNCSNARVSELGHGNSVETLVVCEGFLDVSAPTDRGAKSFR